MRSGEIVALAGLVGAAGQRSPARSSGSTAGTPAPSKSTAGACGRDHHGGDAAGVGLVPEDRRQQGLVMDFSIERNIALASLDTSGEED